MQCTALVFQPNWSHQAFSLEILFLGQEFGWIFVCQIGNPCRNKFLQL